MKKYIPIIVAVLGMVSVFGCSGLSRMGDYIAGTYVTQPPEGTPGRYIEMIDLPYEECYEKALVTVKKIGVSVRHASKKKGTILAWYFDKIYDKCIDTTKVTIYFKEITPQKTQVDVACGNYHLAEFAAERIFKGLKTKS